MTDPKSQIPNTRYPIKREKLGLAGTENYMLILDVLQSDTRSNEERIKDSSKREFEVRCSLARNIVFNETIECSIPEDRGDSFIHFPSNMKTAEISTSLGVYYLSKNAANEISTITLTCFAHSWEEAFDTFLSGITPFLDHLSYQANSPISIDKISCRDKKNDLSIINFRTPYANVTVNPYEMGLRIELFPIYSLYREAKNSTSNYYKFLCYYKILEGIYNHLRPSLMKKARLQQIVISTHKEIVPSHPDLRDFYKIYIGEPIKELFDILLTPEYRHAVSHFRLYDGTLLNPSDYYWSRKFSDVILVSELCAHEVIKNQENYYKQFYQAGGVYVS